MLANKKVLGALAAGITGLVGYQAAKEKFGTDQRVSVINLHGVIMEKGGGSGLLAGRVISLETTRKLIDKAFKPSRLQAVILNINSPGGTPVQSDLVSSYIKEKAAKHNVPVIAFVEDMAASGGYWLACTGTEIYAARCSIVGSIGVISQGFGFHKLIEKYGIERRTYTAGENKSINDPFGPVKEKDVEIISRLQKNIHGHFIEHVKTSRGERLRGDEKVLFNGEFWTAETALELGLIDGIGHMESYISEKWGEDVKVIRVNNGNPLSELLGGVFSSVNTQIPLAADFQLSELVKSVVK